MFVELTLRCLLRSISHDVPAGCVTKGGSHERNRSTRLDGIVESLYPPDESNIQFMIHHRFPSQNSVMLFTPRANGVPFGVRDEA